MRNRISRTAASGSSPRGRGKQVARETRVTGDGLIPAWAGKTLTVDAPMMQDEAHPRVGGENVGRLVLTRTQPGSSPRGRGKRVEAAGEPPVIRLIPAWAGKTGVRGSSGRTRRAHPRVGGENVRFAGVPCAFSGSSPRGRGKRRPSSLRRRAWRLIPAWAGKTLSDLRFYQADRSDLGNP